MLKVETPQEGKNITVQVTSTLEEDIVKPMPFLDVRKLKSPADGIRVDGVIWFIQEKMGVLLWWKERDLLLPLESRGATRFDVGLYKRYGDQWNGCLYLTTFGFKTNVFTPKYFHFTLDMDRL